MKRAGIVYWMAAGVLAGGCGPGSADDSIRVGASTAGTRGGGSAPSGAGGFGGSVSPPGTGGIAGAVGGTGPLGADPRAGVYTEAVVEAEDSPPPIAGGTLAIVGQGHRAAVSDPDHDQVVVVDLDTMTITSTIALSRGDEPGRLVEDGEGRLHVALRKGRGVAVVDPVSNSVLARLPVCGHPRGLAFQASTNAIHVACVGGELVSYTASNGAPLRKLRLERDLRDVVVDGDRLLVSRFRAAELLVVESNGTVTGKLRPPPSTAQQGGRPPLGSKIAAVAWRTVASPDGGALMVYQLLGTSFVPTTAGGYGGGGGTCGGIISTAVSVLRADGSSATVENLPVVLPVDVATTPNREVAVVSAGWTPTSKALFNYVATAVPPVPALTHPRIHLGCGRGSPPPPSPPPANLAFEAESVPEGRVVAVGYGPGQKIVVQTREPATVMFGEQTVFLPGRRRKHTGHELFHLGTLGGLACASCHPEGHEDGQVWNFTDLGPRRTQSIGGGIRGTEPFHWNGDMTDFSVLARDVFNSRMSGPSITSGHVESLLRWIDKIPRMEAPLAEDAAAVERGRAVFNDANVGCASCHSGEKLTNNATVDVKTGGVFQVPSLIGLAWRAPYMHQGCAPTLAGRFDSCAGGDAHGHTSDLTAEQRADLVVYLDTL
jgi:Cytochrome c